MRTHPSHRKRTEPRRHGDTERGGLRTSPWPAWPTANSADALLLEYTGVWPALVRPGFHRPPCSGLRVSVPPWFRKRKMASAGDRWRRPCGLRRAGGTPAVSGAEWPQRGTRGAGNRSPFAPSAPCRGQGRRGPESRRGYGPNGFGTYCRNRAESRRGERAGCPRSQGQTGSRAGAGRIAGVTGAGQGRRGHGLARAQPPSPSSPSASGYLPYSRTSRTTRS